MSTLQEKFDVLVKQFILKWMKIRYIQKFPALLELGIAEYSTVSIKFKTA